ncbi:MAG: TonB-dependent receptor, partial [Phenylobacterium zucineum]
MSANHKKRLFMGCETALAMAAALLVPALAIAQTQAPAPADDQTVTEVVVTGSRLSARGFKAPTPVTVIGSEEIGLSGTQNVETLLNDTPQFLGSQNNGPTANTVPGGTATLNLRGFGAQRNLVLVNGRRFTITGPDQTTDINTIPAALIKRVETVTGGSSAVYGSDAITGVVNFIMKDDFQGVEMTAEARQDTHTKTKTYTADLTFGTNFADDRGNVVVALNYLDRGGYSRADRGGWAMPTMADGCVTASSYSATRPGTPMAIPAGQTCLTAGGRPGLIFGGSGTIPNGRFVPVGSPSSPSLTAALAAAGLSGLGSRGFTF